MNQEMFLVYFFWFFFSSIKCVINDSVNDCHVIRYAYSDRGLDLRDVPRQPIQGSGLKVCSRGLTCCTEEMEEKLEIFAKSQFTKNFKQSANHMKSPFSNAAHTFDESFTNLLTTSKMKFHKLFQRTYGIIYERNSDVFSDFFRDLVLFYEKGSVDIEEAMQNFFSHLYQRMFIVFNAQHNFDYEYLNCVSRTMNKLQPFGDVPKKLTEKLRRSFVATRTFSQAMLEAEAISNRILKIPMDDSCIHALMRLTSCPICQGIPQAVPCFGFCSNVMKGCLAFHSELSQSWDQFIDALKSVADRLIGPFDIEDVVDPIGVKISDAIMNFQNAGYEVTSKVFEDCGTPSYRRRKRQAGLSYMEPERFYHHRGLPQTRDKTDSSLKNLIKDIRKAAENARGMWIKLPTHMCNNSNSPGSGTGCWNGQDSTGTYDSIVVKDGLRHQEDNPEVVVDVGRQHIKINEQIFVLKMITKKLQDAYNGDSVYWPSSETSSYSHSEDEFGNEGSGCNDDADCYHNDGISLDDEDAYSYYDDYGGSGDHHYDDNDVTQDDNDEYEEEEVAIWPPWVTPRTTPQSEEISNDISIEDRSHLPVVSSPSSSGSYSGLSHVLLVVVSLVILLFR